MCCASFIVKMVNSCLSAYCLFCVGNAALGVPQGFSSFTDEKPYKMPVLLRKTSHRGLIFVRNAEGSVPYRYGEG